MSSIEELQKRVSDAEQRFGLIKAQRAKYSERLLSLIDAIETRLHDQHAEIERQAAEITAQAEELDTNRNAVAENQALRGMLHSLLQAIETGGRDVLNETMQIMDAKVSTIIKSNVKAIPALSQASLDASDSDSAEIEAEEEPERLALDGPNLEVENPEPIDFETENTEFDGADGDVAGLESAEIESAELEPEFGADAADETEPAAAAAIEEPLAIEDDVPEAEEAAAEAVAMDEPAVEAGPFAEAEPAADVEVVSEDAVEAEGVAEADASGAPSEDDALAAGEATAELAPEEMPSLEPEMVAEDEPAEMQETLAEDAALEAADEEHLAAEEAPVGAEAPESDVAEMTEPEPEPEPEAEPIAAELAPEAEMPEAESPEIVEADAEIGDAGTLDGLDDSGEAATLEEIMRRVSKLVEEEGMLGKPSRSSVRIGAEPSAQKPKAASNG